MSVHVHRFPAHPTSASLFLTDTPSDYRLLSQSGCYTLEYMDDTWEFSVMQGALTQIGFDDDEKSDIFKLLAAILHLGNLEFTGLWLKLFCFFLTI